MSSAAPDVLDTPQAGAAAIRGGALRVASYAAGVALSVGSAALLFRHLGVEDGGRYVTVLSLVTLAGGLSDVGLAAIGVRELSTRSEAERRPFLAGLLGVRMLLTAIGVAGAVAFAAVAGYGGALVLGTVLAGVGLLLQTVQQTLALGLAAQLRFGWASAFDLLKQVVAVLAIVALVVAGASLVPFLAVGIAAGAAALAATAAVMRRSVSLVPAFRVGEWRSLLRDTLPYALAIAVAALYFRIAILVVSLVAGPTQTGYFGASFRVIEVLVIVPQLLLGAVLPVFARAARDDHDRLAYAVGRTFDACLVLGVGAALVLAAGASFVIDVVAGPSFAPAAPVLRLHAVALAATFVSAIWGYALLSLHRHRAVLVVNSIGLVAVVVLVWALAEADGARGAALATAIAEVVLLAASWVAVQRAGVARAADLRAVPRVLLAAGVAALVLLVPGVPAVLDAVLAGLLYAVGLLVLRAVPREVLDQLPAVGRR